MTDTFITEMFNDSGNWVKTHLKQFLTYARLDRNKGQIIVYDLRYRGTKEFHIPIDAFIYRFAKPTGMQFTAQELYSKSDDWFQCKFRGIKDEWNDFEAYYITKKMASTGVELNQQIGKAGDVIVASNMQELSIVDGKYFAYYYNIQGFSDKKFNTDIEIPKPPAVQVNKSQEAEQRPYQQAEQFQMPYMKQQQQEQELKQQKAQQLAQQREQQKFNEQQTQQFMNNFKQNRQYQKKMENNRQNQIDVDNYYIDNNIGEIYKRREQEEKRRTKELKRQLKRERARQTPLIGRILWKIMDVMDIFRDFAR